MGYTVSAERMQPLFEALSVQYEIFGPRRVAGKKNKNRGPLVRYGKLSSFEEVVWEAQSDFSPKEVYNPIVQTLFFLSDTECVESDVPTDKEYILLAHPCDIHAIARLDKMFLENGGQEDYYYKRLRDKLNIFLMECPHSWDECFCVSMGTNTADEYAMAARFEKAGARFEVQNEAFRPFFAGEEQAAYTPAFIQKNAKQVALPNIGDRSLLGSIHALEYWNRFDGECIGCGGCNTVCPTCSCFDTVDVIYDETSLAGERRRVWSSCMLKSFTVMAGGHGVRSAAGARMRFKTLHKVYDFDARFGCDMHMCVGCGRCERRCPKNIKFSEIVDNLSDEVEVLLPQTPATAQKGAGMV